MSDCTEKKHNPAGYVAKCSFPAGHAGVHFDGNIEWSSLPAINIIELNPGIRGVVGWLRSVGYSMCDSGDGRTREHECDLDDPYVHIATSKDAGASDADRLYRILKERTPDFDIQFMYGPSDGMSHISLFGPGLLDWSADDFESWVRTFATVAHEGQKRKYTGDPYIVHPESVASIVRGVPHNMAMIAAAWLHDTVEDTSVKIVDIVERFGCEVAYLVEWLTDVSLPADGNRAARKAIDRAHSAMAPPEAKTVKLADLIDNSRSIVAMDPEFAKTYLEEKRLLMPFLKEGDSTLWYIASRIANGVPE